jgi:hypothetical protein
MFASRKRSDECSVENLSEPEDQNVVGEGLEDDRPALRMIAVGAQAFALPPLDHAECCLCLPPLSVGLSGEVSPHLRSIVTGRRARRRTPDPRRDDRANAHIVPQQLVHPLRVVSRVKQGRAHSSTRERIDHDAIQMRDVRRRAARGMAGQNEVRATVHHQSHLRKPTIRRGLTSRISLVLGVSRATAHEVTTRVPRLESAGIHRDDRGRSAQQPALHGLLHHRLEHRAGGGTPQQSRGGLLQRGEVRDTREADGLAQIRTVGEECGHAAIIQIEHRLEHEAREELRLRESLGAEAMGVGRKRLFCNRQRRAHHLPWRLAGLHPPGCTRTARMAQP